MRITVRDALFLFDTINTIANKDNIRTIPIVTKFLLSRNIRVLEPIWKEYQETKQKLLIDNSSPTDKEGERFVAPEQAEYFNSEIDKLQNAIVEISLTPIHLSSLEDLNLNLVEVNGLYPIIQNEEV